MKIVTNSNKELVADIRARIKANDGYCPCRLTKTEDTRCICKEFLEQDFEGPCHCGLYIKTEA
jgi:ferredoxin-thioredoxin reductase catalytic subunit